MKNRREFLKAGLISLSSLAIGGAIGYVAKPTQVVEVKQAEERKIKAAWIYIGPIGDYGWTHAHDVGRRIVDEEFDWLETKGVESVKVAEAENVMEEYINQGFNVIFTTSFDFMDQTYITAEKYPDVIFFHCSGYKRRPNMGTYFADFYQVYYLNGLVAGALTKTGKVGYVAAHLIPEVIRHINAFTIGINEVNPDAKVYVIRIGAWYAPDLAREAAATLVEQIGCDVLGFTEDTPATIEYAQSLYEERGILVPVFSHYSPMYEYGRDVVVTGQVVRWDKIYRDILVKVYAGQYTSRNLENVDYWYLLDTDAVGMGGISYDDKVWINDKFKPALSKVEVTEKYTGRRMNILELIEYRYRRMADPNIPFEPFTGPLTGRWWFEASMEVLGEKKSKGDRVVIPPGIRLGHKDLWDMGWFLDSVIVQE